MKTKAVETKPLAQMDTHEMARAALVEVKVVRATALADRHDWTREVKALHEVAAKDAERVTLLESRVDLLSGLIEEREAVWTRRAIGFVVALGVLALSFVALWVLR